jgi:uncharacterized coiled-coil protein SlyX
MEWLNIILGSLVALFAGLNVFQIFTFRAYKKKYKAEAEKEEAEAAESKQSALERRLTALESFCTQQGDTIDALRKDILRISNEKFEIEKKIVLLERENERLDERCTTLTRQLEAYKTISGK